jgi:hypothetical protein
MTGGSQAGHVHPPGQGERGHGHRAIRGERHDPAGLLPGALAARLLLRGEVLAGRLERGRISHEFLLAGVHAKLPQAGHRVAAALAAQEGDPAAVRRHRERARDTESEPPGPGLLAREAFRHDPRSCHRRKPPVAGG